MTEAGNGRGTRARVRLRDVTPGPERSVSGVQNVVQSREM
ncbi:Protein AUXIN SIGNALING F-BOX 2 [Senna tora]|uniref:Protein AUXIN SIGNALING F-BOX 2 n=1 Tax=Senna tora TaxID=362788 RepID=A0A834T388_9FABA|nr:Protein AUXIN SIGNALING F-BOX 2 [Senna tora]